jgi:3-hydroxymyristoyl/3-hydroxydecanoyl-(acyl carrier protein) dehydratase
VSSVSDVIIESFAFQVLSGEGLVYEGHTVFGFFTAESLADQKGVKIDEDLRGIGANVPEDSGPVVRLPDEKPLTPMDAGAPGSASGLSMPAKALRMIDRVDHVWPMGGPAGLGYLHATKIIDPKEWFFDAHFYKDPVCPGSLGIESFLQVLKYEALRRWDHLNASHRFEPVFQVPHTWQYRGQIVPDNRRVEVEAFITAVKNEPDPELRADGILKVDGLPIYLMKDYGLRLVPLA